MSTESPQLIGTFVIEEIEGKCYKVLVVEEAECEGINKPDYLSSQKTKAGWSVKGLFRDAEFIRGYYSTGEFWTSGTWIYATGMCVISKSGNRHKDLVKY